jgi:hypothetical protein
MFEYKNQERWDSTKATFAVIKVICTVPLLQHVQKLPVPCEGCDGKFNVAYCHDLVWKLPITPCMSCYRFGLIEPCESIKSATSLALSSSALSSIQTLLLLLLLLLFYYHYYYYNYYYHYYYYFFFFFIIIIIFNYRSLSLWLIIKSFIRSFAL